MVDKELILDRIRTDVYLNNVHFVEWFEDFDKLRSGRVTKDQFRRCFELAKIPLSDNEFRYLDEKYCEKEYINYRRFCSDISIIFSNPDLLVNPTGSLVDSKEIVGKIHNRLNLSMTPEMDGLFSKMYHQMKTRGIHVRESYLGFDKHNSGHVSKSQFARSLPFIDLSPKELQLLTNRYLDPILNDVNYKRLHLDLIEYGDIKSDHESTKAQILPHQQQSITLHPLPSNINDVIHRFSSYVNRNRVRIKDFFESRDPLKTGKISTDSFKNVLTLFGFQFSPDELEYLAQRYNIHIDFTDFSNYRQFCEEVRQTEKSLSIETNNKITTTNEIKSIIPRIKDYVIKNGINVLPPFQDFDKSHRGYVTELQFHRVISILTIPISNNDVSALVRCYLNNMNEVDYFRFVEDIDIQHKQQRRAYKPLGNDKESIEQTFGRTPNGDAFVTPEEADQLIYQSKKGLIPKIQEYQDVESLISNLQHWCYIHSIHFDDFMKDYDKFNLGEITETQMRSSLYTLGYRLTDNEFALLAQHYQSPKNHGYILWRKLSDDILSFSSPKIIERLPTLKPKPPSEIVQETLHSQKQQDTIPDNVMKILERVHKYVIGRRISLTEQFLDKDKYNHKAVTTTSFAQVIQLIGVHISMNDINLLSSYYMNPSTHFVQYPKFIKDIEALGGINETTHNTVVLNPPPSYALDISSVVSSQPSISAEQIKWHTLLPRIQSFVLKRRIRIKEFFENFDRLKHGKIPIQKFRTVIGETGIPLLEDEIQFIAKLFAPENQPDMFHYREFVNQIDLIFGTPNLHRQPNESSNTRATYIPDPSQVLHQLTEQENSILTKLISRMKNFVSTRRMEVSHQFEDYDKHPRRNYITKAQFRQCIARLGLTSNEKELDILCKRYRCTDLDEMNYISFCTDIGGNASYDIDDN